MITTFGPERVSRISSLHLTASPAPWPYADNHREAIDAHWRLASAANPNFFNGIVHVITTIAVEDEHVRAEFMPAEFKNFLYWRDEGYPAEARVRDGFGSALIRTSDGHIILGRQRPGNINEGLAYLPGGFIDSRDVREDGRIDIVGSVARELREETGLGPGDLDLEDGFLLVEAGAHVSFALPYRSRLNARELTLHIARFLAQEQDPELAETVSVRGAAEISGLAMPYYARVLLSSPLAWRLP